MAALTTVLGDITKQAVDAIVNAASPDLLGGGGVDGAIHAAAGPKLLEECKTLGGCPTGEAKVTQGYDLSVRYVIHTVGPVYGNEGGREAELLALCYQNCLVRAQEKGISTIAFPAISTGAYGYPPEDAAKIALETVRDAVQDDISLQEVRFVLHTEDMKKIYDSLLAVFALAES